MRISLGLALNRRRAGAGAAVAPVLSGFAISDAGAGVGNVTLATDIDCTAYFWIGPTGTTPTASEVRNGTGATATFSQAVTISGGPYSPSLPAGLNGNYRASVVGQVGAGALSNVLTQSPVAFDTQVPGVSSYSPADNATDVAIASDLVITFNEAMTTNVGSVSLYTDADVLVQTFDLSSVGTWTVSDTVLTLNPTSDMANSTGHYVLYSGLTDANGNALPNVTDKTVWNFTTAAAASALTITYISSVTRARGTNSTADHIVSAASMGTETNRLGIVVIGSTFFASGSPVWTNATINGDTRTPSVQQGSANTSATAIWWFPGVTGTSQDITLNPDGSCFDARVTWYAVYGTGTVTVLDSAAGGTASATTHDVSVDTVDGAAVFAGALTVNGTQMTLSGVTTDTNGDMRSNEFFAHGSHEATAAETPRSVTATTAGSEIRSVVALSLRTT